MASTMPQEIEVWYIIPAIRRDMSKIMYKKGMKQTEIATILGVTKSAVSQYISSKRASDIEFNDEIMKEINRSVELITNKDSSAFREIQNICKTITDTSFICQIRKKLDNEPLPECNDCILKKKV